MAAPTLHIVFSEAGAETLGKALRLAGRDDRVLAIHDDLASGALGDPRLDAAFPDEALAAGAHAVIWTDRRVARSYAGLLAWAARAGKAAYAVVDLTHAGTAPLHRLEPGAAAPLLELAATVSAEARTDLTEDWEDLRTENAALRLVAAGRLVSAPPTAFDEAILDQCSPYWMRRELVVGMVISEDGWRGIWNGSETVIEARIDALAAAGHLEVGTNKAGGEIRLRPLEPSI